LALTLLLGYWKKVSKEEFLGPLVYAPLDSQRVLGRIYRFLVFVDFQIRLLGFVRIPLLLGMIVICDRYLYDIVIGQKIYGLSSQFFERAIALTSPRPQLVFLLDVPEAVASKRRNLPIEDVSRHKREFLDLGKSLALLKLDGSDEFQTTQAKVRGTVLALLSAISDNQNPERAWANVGLCT
jgi:thymidylate kinase